jgi:hypothetical protein
MRRRVTTRWILLAVLSLASSACDLVAVSGQTFRFGNRGTITGTAGNAQRAPLPAVRVQPGGGVVVEDADVLGGGILIQNIRQPSFGPVAAAGISANGGMVRVEKGLVRGGDLVLNVPLITIGLPGAAIDAHSSVVEITGGTIAGGAIVSPLGPSPSQFTGRALEAINSKVTITGGTFLVGTVSPEPPFPMQQFASVSLVLGEAEIRGGSFGDEVSFFGGRARIFGGTAIQLRFGTPANAPQGCFEIHGGSYRSLLYGSEQVLVFGTGLALSSPPIGNRRLLTGTLEDGSPIHAFVNSDIGFEPLLLAPGSPGCP